MKIIIDLYYQNNIIDSQAHTITKKKGKACPLNVHVDAALDNTVAPHLIAKAVRAATKKSLIAAARRLHDKPRPPQKGA